MKNDWKHKDIRHILAFVEICLWSLFWILFIIWCKSIS
jgi:hypothetical protein